MLQSLYSSKRFSLKGLHQGLFQMLFFSKMSKTFVIFIPICSRQKNAYTAVYLFPNVCFLHKQVLQQLFFSQSVQTSIILFFSKNMNYNYFIDRSFTYLLFQQLLKYICTTPTQCARIYMV
jgi:positive regulator of sigma E activity